MPDDGPSRDAVALRSFLAERDAACPGCGYNLRGLQTSQCPECGQKIALKAAAVGDEAAPPTGTEYAAHLRYVVRGAIGVLAMMALVGLFLWEDAAGLAANGLLLTAVVAIPLWIVSLTLRRRDSRRGSFGARRVASMTQLRWLAIAASVGMGIMSGYTMWVWYAWFVEVGFRYQPTGATYWFGGYGPPGRLDCVMAWTSALALAATFLASIVAFAMLLRARTDRDRINAVRVAAAIAFMAIILSTLHRAMSWTQW